MGWSQNLFRGLWRALSKETKVHVGTDPLGNKYYYVPEYKNWRGQIIREKRSVEAANKKEIDYEVGNIPPEWEAWIRRTRKTPPTMEVQCPYQQLGLNILQDDPTKKIKEVLANENYREEIKIKSEDLYEKEKLISKETNEELLAPPVQTQIRGHASAPYFGKEEPSVAPTSTGKTFQPGSWMPQDRKSHNQ